MSADSEGSFDLDAYLDAIAADLAEAEADARRWKETTARALLLSIERLGRKAFQYASTHRGATLVMDLETYDTDIVDISELPRHFNMARREQGLVNDALFCEDDFSRIRELKAHTHGKTSLISHHFACPVFIAPQRLHKEQSTAWICVAVWDTDERSPWTNLPLIEP